VANPPNTLSFLAFAEHAWTGAIGLIVIDAHHGTMVWSMADAPHALELRAFAKNTNLTLIRDLPDNSWHCRSSSAAIGDTITANLDKLIDIAKA
jgi:hypothetical protein